jgi:hypothetical protein
MPRHRIKREVDALKASRPGRRFEDAHERHRIDNHAVRLAVLAIGALLALAGALTFWVPGPNFVIVLIGLAIVGGQWRFAARMFDRLEVASRRWHDEHWEPYEHKTRALVIIWLVVATLLVAAAWFAAGQGWLPGWVPLVD